jgi:hypothetical protein
MPYNQIVYQSIGGEMKKFTVYLISCFILLFLMSGVLRAQINTNGGFETGTPGVHAGTEIEGWELSMGGTSLADFTIVTDAENVHSGAQALQIVVTAIGTNAWEPQIINLDFPIQSNTAYTISAWLKADLEGALVSVTMGAPGPSYYEWGRQGNVALGVEYQQVTFTVTTRNPETETVGRVPIHLGPSGNSTMLPLTFWVDDVEVTTPDAIDNNGETVSVLDQYALKQNYPNPFNPTTTIEFSLPEKGDIHLILSDILGRVVQEMASGTYDAGSHKVTVNLSNLPSGVYFYTLKTNSFMNTKKLVLMK